MFLEVKVILGLWVVNFKPGFGLGFNITIANWDWIQKCKLVLFVLSIVK